MQSLWLPRQAFLTLLRSGPLVSMDLVVRDPEGRVLVGLRTHRPARGAWFVPGGRMAKGESLDEAFARIAEAELGRPFRRSEARFLGVFEHFYEDNRLEEPGLGTHYVVLAHELNLREPLDLPQDQHEAFAWMEEGALLAHPGVHENTKAYFRPDQ